MESEPGATPAAWQRLHAASLLFTLVSAVYRLLIPGLLVTFFARGGGFEIGLMVLFVPAVLAAILKYFSFRYRLAPGEMVFRQGVLFKNERHIPYARVQSIELSQNPAHRFFGVARVQVETAGGLEPEASLSVLSLRVVEEMRRRVFAERGRPPGPGDAAAAAGPGGAGAVADQRLVTRLGAGDVALFGFLSRRGWFMVLGALGIAWELDLWPLPDTWEPPPILRELDSARELIRSPLGSIPFLAAAIAGLWAVLRILSIAWAFLRYHGFTLIRQGEDLRARYGLFTRVAATIPRHRIQVVRISETPLQRLLGRVSVRVETAGGEIGEGSALRQDWLVPILRKQDLPAIVREAQPDVSLETLDWRPVDPRGRRRIFRKGLLPGLILAAAGFALAGWGGLLVPAVALPLAHLNARRQIAHMGYAVAANAVAFRRGWWRRRMALARYAKMQVLTFNQSPFDRLYGMASVRVDTAGAALAGGPITVPYLRLDDARRVFDHLGARAAATRLRW
jgi:putative membrane protein